MEKTRIDLEIILPDQPEERDYCVQRIIQSLSGHRAIEQVHIVKNPKNEKAQLCFHYNPQYISIHQIENLARQQGAAIAGQYGHLVVEVPNIRHTRHARRAERRIVKIPGLINPSLGSSGFLRFEYDKTITSEESLRKSIAETVDEHDLPDGKKPETGIVNWLAEKKELVLSIICGIFLGLGFGLSFIDSVPNYIPIILYCLAYVTGGYYTLKESIEGLRKGKFEIDFLMLVAAIGAAILGDWAEGALLLFLFSMGHALEHYSMDRAKKSIKALAELTPKTALLKTSSIITEIPIESLERGNIILVKPNTKIAADGLIISGSGSVNQAPITGESIPADKYPYTETDISAVDFTKAEDQYKVFAGSINGSASLEILVSRTAEDSTISRMVKLVNEAQTQKSTTQNFAEKIERYYVPAVLIMVSLLLFAFLVIDEKFSDSFYRAMAVLVAASPCALAISTPSAVLSGVARAARGGILIKGGKPLEKMAGVSTIAFDKTGTLTQGKPALTGIYPLEGISEEELLPAIIAVEKLSDHPLAAAIVKGATARLKQDIPAAGDAYAITGRGIRARYENTIVHIGNKELFTEKGDQISDDLLEKISELERQGNTTMLVQQGDRLTGIITLMDIPREDARETLIALRKTGIRKMIMLTGDNQRVADAIAKQIGLTEAIGNLLPDQKVDAIEKLMRQEGSVAMLGDGVNDAPAMAKSSVGIAMGAAGSDVALETADVALMADKLINLPFAIALSRKARTIITQNLIISLGMVAVLIPLTLTGIASMGPAVIGHEGSTLIVVLNALRLLGYKNPYRKES